MTFLSRLGARVATAALLVGMAVARSDAADPLPAMAADPVHVSVSGVSSGGFMATQYQVAHSAQVTGVGVIAAGPWYCAGSGFPFNAVTVFNRCMNLPDLLPFLGPPDLAPMVAETRRQAREGHIDDPAHLQQTHVYLFSGGKDDLVPRPVVQALKDYYATFVGADRIRFETGIEAVHAMVTTDFGNPCATFSAPFINDCDYDAAGAILQQAYGPLSPPVAPTGRLQPFDQTPFLPATGRHGLAREGYVYIPTGCEAGGCRVHVAFHGCAQNAAMIGDAFYRHAGYNRWAEANRIIVLYPQATAVRTRLFGIDLPWPNPQACWDWWGFTGDDYPLQSAVQIRAAAAMIDRLAATP